MAAPRPENLQRLARLLADGTLRVPIQATYELVRSLGARAADRGPSRSQIAGNGLGTSSTGTVVPLTSRGSRAPRAGTRYGDHSLLRPSGYEC
jgi:hypothetical protein